MQSNEYHVYWTERWPPLPFNFSYISLVILMTLPGFFFFFLPFYTTLPHLIAHQSNGTCWFFLHPNKKRFYKSRLKQKNGWKQMKKNIHNKLRIYAPHQWIFKDFAASCGYTDETKWILKRVNKNPTGTKRVEESDREKKNRHTQKYFRCLCKK